MSCSDTQQNNPHFQYTIALQNIKCELQVSSDFLRFSKCFSKEMEVGFQMLLVDILDSKAIYNRLAYFISCSFYEVSGGVIPHSRAGGGAVYTPGGYGAIRLPILLHCPALYCLQPYSGTSLESYSYTVVNYFSPTVVHLCYCGCSSSVVGVMAPPATITSSGWSW